LWFKSRIAGTWTGITRNSLFSLCKWDAACLLDFRDAAGRRQLRDRVGLTNDVTISRPDRSEPRLVVSPVYEDNRGWFTELYSNDLSESHGELAGTHFVQDNVSLSKRPGTVRGLHFQLAPSAQDKLISVLSGAIFDVAVDVRRSSPRFGQHQAVELSAGSGHKFFIPAGFAHGFVSLEPDTVVFYKVSNQYAPALDRGIAWDDPRLAIDWPLRGSEAQISERDRALPRLDDAIDLFP
jgi:dTDP-4-dehydrorhamnose 3,5-epimerase